MEIVMLEDNAVKVKGKLGSIVIEPTKKVKTTADAMLFYAIADESNFSSDLEKSSRVSIVGPGEYEISGIKINGFGNGDQLLYAIVLDGVDILVGKASVLEKAHGKQKDTEILLCNCDTIASPASLLSLSPRIAVLFGEKAEEVSSGLGKGTKSKVSKFVTAADKFPAEMEVILLG